MFIAAKLQQETAMHPMPEYLSGLHCREIPEEPTMLEVATKGFCEVCNAAGFYNFMRILRPTDWQRNKELQLGGVIHAQAELTPQLVHQGPDGGYVCPGCHLAWLDPVNFAKEIKV